MRRRTKVPLRDLGPMRAADAGWTIAETTVAYHPREGRSKVTGTLRGTVRAVRDMAAVLR